MNDFSEDIIQCLVTLKEGGIILYPTDTIWGIGCDATNESAISRVFEIKKRSLSKSLIILVDSISMINEYIESPSNTLADYLRSAKTPTTAIFEKAKNLPGKLVNADGSIAIRIASDNFCKKLIGKFGSPIVSTSANISDKPSPKTFSEIEPEIIHLMDYTVVYRQKDHSIKNPSHIIRLNNQNEVERIR